MHYRVSKIARKHIVLFFRPFLRLIFFKIAMCLFTTFERKLNQYYNQSIIIKKKYILYSFTGTHNAVPERIRTTQTYSKRNI